MNLLAKYKAMVTTPKSPLSLAVDDKPNTEEREKNQKGLIKGTADRIDKTPSREEEVSNRAAIITPEIVAPKTIVSAIWVNPHKQRTPEGRRESLLQCMEATWVTTFDRIAAGWPKGFIATLEIHAAEIEIERVQALVLSGKATLAAFRQAVESWEQVCKKEISGPKH